MGLVYTGSSQAKIDSPGDYTIDRDLTQFDPNLNCVSIDPGVHYVTIRLRSRLVGAGGVNSTNSGIFTNGNADVKIIGDGGSIRGFGYGIKMLGANIPRVRDIFIQDALFRGIKIEGSDLIITDCDVRNVFGAMWTPNAYCMGIEVSGTSNPGMPKVIRNLVQKALGTGNGEGVGISITDFGQGGIVSGNIIKNDSKPNKMLGAGASIGVWCGGQSDVKVAHNMIDTWDFGCVFSSTPSGEIDEDTFSNCTTNILLNSGSVTVGGIDG